MEFTIAASKGERRAPLSVSLQPRDPEATASWRHGLAADCNGCASTLLRVLLAIARVEELLRRKGVKATKKIAAAAADAR